jgi:hypothetical protein
MASAARIVGSSRFAGVPVLDRDRRVDFPKAPLSDACFLVLVVPEWESELLSSVKVSDMFLQRHLPRKDHCIWSLNSIITNVQFVVWNVVEN